MKALSTAVALGAAAVFTTGCGGGVKHLSEITPARQQRLTGHWVLNEKESTPPDSIFQRPGGRGRGGGARGEPGEGGEGGAGGRGGLGGRGGFGGRGGGMGGGIGGGMEGRGGGFGGRGGGGGGGAAPRRASQNPAVMQASRRMMMNREQTLDVSLTDSTATVRYPGEEEWVLFFGKTVERKVNDDVTLKAKAEWDNERLTITRSVSGGGTIHETFEPALDAARLIVDVDVSMGGGGPRGGREFQRVYYPKGSRPGDR